MNRISFTIDVAAHFKSDSILVYESDIL